MLRCALLLASLYFFFVHSQSLAAQPKAGKTKRPKVQSQKILEIRYGNAAWNRDPGKIDTASVVLKDSRNGRLVLIRLFEQGPDESLFRGQFRIQWQDDQEFQPEIYIAEQILATEARTDQRLLELVRDNKLPRKAFVLSRDRSGQQSLEVFDSKEQARLALENYRQRMQAEKQGRAKEESLGRENSVLAASMLEQKLRLERQQKNLEAEAERIRLRQLEEKRQREQLERQQQLQRAERLRREKLAQEKAQQAIELYYQGNFVGAEQNFEQAVELDPNNKSYYYAFAISLYRNEKFNRALVIFDASQGDDIDPLEKDYYRGLCYFRLNDFSLARQSLSPLKISPPHSLSASAAFYEGLSFYAEKKWTEAKESFQWVLDHSQDVKLDEQAESYIEKILRIQAFEKNQAQRHLLTTALGLQYDSNILLNSEDPSSAFPSGQGDIRYTGIAGYEYRMLFEQKQEWSLRTNLVYIYSQKEINSKADPMLVSLASPYVRKGKWREKAFRSEFLSFYDSIYMDPELGQERRPILDIYGLAWNNTLIQSPKKFTALNLRIANNLSYNTAGDFDADALQTDIDFNNTWFLDDKNQRALIQESRFTYFNAVGINERHYRITAAVSYLNPLPWGGFTSLSRLALFFADYPDGNENRADTNIQLSYNLTKSLSEHWNWVQGFSYTKNDSSVAARSFSKFVVNSMLTANWRF